MLVHMSIEVVPSTTARDNLPKYLKRFRRSPGTAQPVILGPNRKAEAVLIPIAQYRELLERAEAVSVRAEIDDVLAHDTGDRGKIADLAREHGFDPAEFGLA